MDEKSSFAIVIFRAIEQHYKNSSKDCPFAIPFEADVKNSLWFTHLAGVNCVKLLGRVRNHYSHQVRTMTQKLLKEEDADGSDDESESTGLTMAQKLMNLTCCGYHDANAYSAAKPILAHVALYRKTSKNERAYNKDGKMTQFACRTLNLKIVQDFLTVGEEAFVYLCIRKEIIRRMYDSSHTIFTAKIRKAFIDCDECAYNGSVEELTLHAKDGFRTEEINFFLETKVMLKEQRRAEKAANTSDKVSKFHYIIPSTSHTPNSSKKRRHNPEQNKITLDTDDEGDDYNTLRE